MNKTVYEVPVEIAQRIAAVPRNRRWEDGRQRMMPFEYIAIIVYLKHGKMLTRQGIHETYKRGMKKVRAVAMADKLEDEL